MSKRNFALGVVVGAALGVIAGWFTAPKSGKEMRADAKAKAKEVYEDVRDRSEDFIDDAKEKLGELGEKAKSGFGWFKSDAEKEVRSARRAADKFKK